MHLKSVIAVIDIGKTNVKLVLVNPDDLKEVDVRTQANNVIAGPPYPHYDIEGIWAFIVQSLIEFSNIFEIQAISVTTHGASCALIDHQCNLVTPVLDYEFDGPDALSNDYDAIRPDFSETGSPRLSLGLNLGAQLHWLFNQFPDVLNKADFIVTYPQYWVARLTGVPLNEYTSLGCHTDLWDPRGRKFSPLVERLGIADLMAPVAKANTKVGPVKSELAAEMGLSPDIQVYCGIHDSNASLYPYLQNSDLSFSTVSTGTWVVSMSVNGDEIALNPELDTLINVNGNNQPVPSARFMGGREFELLTKGHERAYDQDDVSSVIASGVTLLPSIVKESGPFQGREHEWVGATETDLSDGERYVAISFYLALMTAQCLKLIGAKGTAIIEGPFAKNELYCQMLSVATGCPAVPSKGTGTSIGAALLTGINGGENLFPETGDVFQSPEFKTYATKWFNFVN